MTVDKILQDIENQARTAVDPTTAGVDSITLREVTSVITTITSLILGVAITIIVIAVPIIVTLELAFINFPAFRQGFNLLEARLEKINTKGITRRTLEFTFRDAKQAVISAETKMTGRSATWEYIKIKCKSIMFIVFVISLVGLGSGTFLGIAKNLFSGIIDLIMRLVYNIVGYF